MLLRLKHVKRVRSKGRIYYYHRRTGERLPEDGELRAQRVLEINAGAREPTATSGSVAGLVANYRAARDFTSLAEKTRRDYGRYLGYFEEVFGDLPVAEIDREFVIELRDTFSGTPRKADYLVRVLSVLCTFAIDRPKRYGLASNPASRLKRIAVNEGYKPWPDDLIAAFRHKAYPQLLWAMEMGLYTGQRLNSCTRMAWPHYDGEGIDVEPNKRGNRVWVPVHPDFKPVLESIPKRNVAILTTKTGRPWTVDFLSHEVARCIAECGLSGYSFHGLRKNAARNLAEAGASAHEIISITGHKSLAMVELYTREVRQKATARRAMAKLPRKK